MNSDLIQVVFVTGFNFIGGLALIVFHRPIIKIILGLRPGWFERDPYWRTVTLIAGGLFLMVVSGGIFYSYISNSPGGL